MPKGKGTYGNVIGRPPKKKNKRKAMSCPSPRKMKRGSRKS